MGHAALNRAAGEGEAPAHQVPVLGVRQPPLSPVPVEHVRLVAPEAERDHANDTFGSRLDTTAIR